MIKLIDDNLVLNTIFINENINNIDEFMGKDTLILLLKRNVRDLEKMYDKLNKITPFVYGNEQHTIIFTKKIIERLEKI